MMVTRAGRRHGPSAPVARQALPGEEWALDRQAEGTLARPMSRRRARYACAARLDSAIRIRSRQRELGHPGDQRHDSAASSP